MRKLIPLALAALAVGVTAALASGATAHSRAQATPLAQSLAAARLATAKYATDLNRAKADGYQIITQMIPDMGYHYLNPKVSGFNVTCDLGAVDWGPVRQTVLRVGTRVLRAAGAPGRDGLDPARVAATTAPDSTSPDEEAA